MGPLAFYCTPTIYKSLYWICGTTAPVLIESAASVLVYNINVQRWKNVILAGTVGLRGAWKRANLLETAWRLSAQNTQSPVTQAILEHVHTKRSIFSVSPKGSSGDCVHFISIHHGFTFSSVSCMRRSTLWTLLLAVELFDWHSVSQIGRNIHSVDTLSADL